MRTSDDEVGELVDVFNAMLDELGRRALTLEQANRALRESDERYQLAVRGSSAGLWDWDIAGRHDVLFAPLQGIARLQRGGIPRPADVAARRHARGGPGRRAATHCATT